MQQTLNLDINTATQEQLELAFYDKFNVRLEKLQILLATPGQDWSTPRMTNNDYSLHIVKPTGEFLTYLKSIFRTIFKYEMVFTIYGNIFILNRI